METHASKADTSRAKLPARRQTARRAAPAPVRPVMRPVVTFGTSLLHTLTLLVQMLEASETWESRRDA